MAFQRFALMAGRRLHSPTFGASAIPAADAVERQRQQALDEQADMIAEIPAEDTDAVQVGGNQHCHDEDDDQRCQRQNLV